MPYYYASTGRPFGAAGSRRIVACRRAPNDPTLWRSRYLISSEIRRVQTPRSARVALSLRLRSVICFPDRVVPWPFGCWWGVVSLAEARQVQRPEPAPGRPHPPPATCESRDLLHTHSATRAEDTREPRSECAPVVICIPIARAVLHEVAGGASQITPHCGQGSHFEHVSHARRTAGAECRVPVAVGARLGRRSCPRAATRHR